ncbi:hypothetical protein ACIQBJ_31795 [Kitasatospora sp. NPDC088391]|uniref:hypothetical protein n=1 Tax=Kitasatospora sp. NPDC088391 TaxID=3364074 RepID=UPI0037FC94F4
MTKDLKCTHCGGHGLEQGFLEDSGENSHGDARWIAGALERGFFGKARRIGRPRHQVDAFRCPDCGHLELFASRRLSG